MPGRNDLRLTGSTNCCGGSGEISDDRSGARIKTAAVTGIDARFADLLWSPSDVFGGAAKVAISLVLAQQLAAAGDAHRPQRT